MEESKLSEEKENKSHWKSNAKTFLFIAGIFAFAIVYGYSTAYYSTLIVDKNIGNLVCPKESCDTCRTTGISDEIYCCRYLQKGENDTIQSIQCNRLQQLLREDENNNTIIFYRILVDKAIKEK